MGNYIINGNVWEGFNTNWIASVAIVGACYFIKMGIEVDLFSWADGISIRRGGGSYFYKKK